MKSLKKLLVPTALLTALAVPAVHAHPERGVRDDGWDDRFTAYGEFYGERGYFRGDHDARDHQRYRGKSKWRGRHRGQHGLDRAARARRLGGFAHGRQRFDDHEDRRHVHRPATRHRRDEDILWGVVLDVALGL